MPNPTILAAGEAMPDADYLAAREHFERLYSNWLHARAVHADPSQDESDGAVDARADKIEYAARLLLSTPVVLPWMIYWKVEVLEHWLDHEDAKWTDNRVSFALGCVKADLARFISPVSGLITEEE